MSKTAAACLMEWTPLSERISSRSMERFPSFSLEGKNSARQGILLRN